MGETHLRQSRQTVKLGLIKTVNDLFPEEKLKTAYSIQEGVFCRLHNSILSEREVKQIGVKLNEWAQQSRPIEFLGRQDGYNLYNVDGLLIKALYPAYTNSSKAETFRLIPYSAGFIVDFGDIDKGALKPLIPPDKLSETYEKTQRWLKNINVELVSDVNSYVEAGKSMELLSIAEALQEKEISGIADMILQQRRALRVLLISGPSSSGKTSFAQRLSTQLRVNGFKPVPLSLDDYFVNREDTPKDSNGRYDFESLDALDLKLLKDHIEELIDGNTVETPLFDFVTGHRSDRTKTMHVGNDEILVIEGIHALNPSLMPDINRNIFFKSMCK
jgi:uridine kinase